MIGTNTFQVRRGPISVSLLDDDQVRTVVRVKALDLFVNLRPVWSLPGVPTRYTNIDLIIVRENTEDLYSGLEHEVVPGVVESLKIITEKASRRISEFAFANARKLGRKKVTAVHKANIMKLSDGLFLDCARNVSREYPDIEYDELTRLGCSFAQGYLFSRPISPERLRELLTSGAPEPAVT